MTPTVGSHVVTQSSDMIFTVVALDGDWAWLRSGNHYESRFLADLDVIEDTAPR